MLRTMIHALYAYWKALCEKKWIQMRQVRDNSVLYWSDESENEKKWVDLQNI